MKTVCEGCDLCREALLTDPDPRPTIHRRILEGSLRPDLTTDAEVCQWISRQRKRHQGASKVEVIEDDGQVE